MFLSTMMNMTIRLLTLQPVDLMQLGVLAVYQEELLLESMGSSSQGRKPVLDRMRIILSGNMNMVRNQCRLLQGRTAMMIALSRTGR